MDNLIMDNLLRVICTRPEEQNQELIACLKEYFSREFLKTNSLNNEQIVKNKKIFQLHSFPLIKIEFNFDEQRQRFFEEIISKDKPLLIFTSSNACRATKSLARLKSACAVVGVETAKIATELGFNVVLTAPNGNAQDLLEELFKFPRDIPNRTSLTIDNLVFNKLIFFRGDIVNKSFFEGLSKHFPQAEEYIVYQSICPDKTEQEIEQLEQFLKGTNFFVPLDITTNTLTQKSPFFDNCVTIFTSSQSIENFEYLLKNNQKIELLENLKLSKCIAIGDKTLITAKKFRFKKLYLAEEKSNYGIAKKLWQITQY